MRSRDSTLPDFVATGRRSGRGRPISRPHHGDETVPTAGIALLFRKGVRPDAAAVRVLAEEGGFTVWHDPSSMDKASGSLALLINGLAFDLVGLGGGDAAPPLAVRHSVGIDDAELGIVETVALVAGPHLTGGEAMLPVVRSQLALALRLTRLPGVVAVTWAPARCRMATDYFETRVSAWLEGGAFPIPGLAALVPSPDGGLQSEGLAFFTGQELRIEPDCAERQNDASELAALLIHQLVSQDPVDRRFEFVWADGTPLLMEPSANGRFVRVRPA